MVRMSIKAGANEFVVHFLSQTLQKLERIREVFFVNQRRSYRLRHKGAIFISFIEM